MTALLRAVCLGLLLSIGVLAQPATPAAPVPTQVLNAKKIFVSNVPGFQIPESSGGSYRTYNQFYAAMKVWGKYELVTTPADSDVVFEVSFTNPLTNVSSGNATGKLLVNLLIVDPKTNVPLWWISEEAEGAILSRTMDKNFDHAMAKLIERLKKLVGDLPDKP